MSVVGYEYLLQQLYSGVLDDEAFAREVKKIENNNTDWFAILTRDVISHNHTLSISGGTESLRYYSSIGYSRDNDVIRDQEISRYIHTNISLSITQQEDAQKEKKGKRKMKEFSKKINFSNADIGLP